MFKKINNYFLLIKFSPPVGSIVKANHGVKRSPAIKPSPLVVTKSHEFQEEEPEFNEDRVDFEEDAHIEKKQRTVPIRRGRPVQEKQARTSQLYI